MSYDDLLQYLPPTVRYRREPLEDEHNALSYWGEAARRWSNPHSISGATVSTARRAASPMALSRRARWTRRPSRGSANSPNATLRRTHCSARESSVDRYSSRSSQRKAAAWASTRIPSAPCGTWLEFGTCSHRLRIAQGRACGCGRRTDRTRRDGPFDLLRGQLRHALPGRSQPPGDRGLRHPAARHRTGVCRETLERLGQAVGRWLAEAEGVTQCLRVELCSYALPEIQRLDACGDRRRSWTSSCAALRERTTGRSKSRRKPGEAPDDDDRRAWRRDSLRYLLEGHPAPWELIATVKQLGQLVADGIAELQRPGSWSLVAWGRRLARAYRRSRFRTRASLWPAQLSAHFPYDCLGPERHCAAEPGRTPGACPRRSVGPNAAPDRRRPPTTAGPNSLGGEPAGAAARPVAAVGRHRRPGASAPRGCRRCTRCCQAGDEPGSLSSWSTV